MGVSYGNEPTRALTISNSLSWRAFIIGDQKGQMADENRPAFTVRAQSTGGAAPRAFIIPGSNANSFSVRDDDEPIRTVESVNRPGNVPRAYANGRVVKMTVQALGRFQTVPDTYKGLTVKINGNGVPCLMAQKILETL